MNVRTLKQYLLSLVEPLRAGQVADSTLSGLRAIGEGLEPFANQPVTEMAEFLQRAHTYEQEGHWPDTRPPITGRIVDVPTLEVYVDRLRAYLPGAVPPGGTMSEEVAEEMNRLGSQLKPAQLKELARLVGVTGTVSSGPKAVEKIFEHLTGRPLGQALLEMHAQTLRRSAGTSDLELALARIAKSLNATQTKQLAKLLGIPTNFRAGPQALAAIRDLLTGQPESPDIPSTTPTERDTGVLPPSEEKVNRVVEILQALKRKAEPVDAPFDEIEEELQRLEGELSRDEAILVAEKFGVVRTMHSRKEALEEIRWQIFETRRARESLEY